MCLAVPGEIVAVTSRDGTMRAGKVNFGGIVKEVNLDYVPDATVGDYVLVHVGFALAKVDPEEAGRVFEYLEQMNELEALEV